VPAPPAHRPARAGPAAAVRTLIASRLFRVAFVLAAIGLGGYAVVDQWPQVSAGFAELGAGTIVAALAVVLLALVATMQVWRTLLVASGSRLPFRAAARIFFVGQIGKYLPGAVWSVLAQMELGQVQHVPRRRSAMVAALTLVISLTAGLLTTAAATLPILAASVTAGYRWAFLAVPVVLLCLHPRVLNPLIEALLRLARRPPMEQPLSGRAILAATLWAVLSWVLFGVHVWLLAVRMGAPSGRTVLLAIGGFAFAWCIGFLVVFAPAGAGVREVILIAALSPVLSVGKATAVALASRLMTTVGDLVTAGAAAWFSRRPRGPARE
jgi:glycosyltransferase 2 family protein